jgi:hypothetical protein
VRMTFPDRDDAFAALSASLGLGPDELERLRPSFDRLLASCNGGLTRVEISARYLLAVGRTPEG